MYSRTLLVVYYLSLKMVPRIQEGVPDESNIPEISLGLLFYRRLKEASSDKILLVGIYNILLITLKKILLGRQSLKCQTNKSSFLHCNYRPRSFSKIYGNKKRQCYTCILRK